MVRVAVDVLVGRLGIDRLRAAGHDVVVEARHGESDRDWFSRARDCGAEVVIAADNDLAVRCYDHRVDFFKAQSGDRGRVVAERFIRWHAKRAARRTS